MAKRPPEPKTEAEAAARKTVYYTEEEIDRGLVEVALCGGNTRKAHRRLKEEGITISRPTLERWANRHHVKRYETLRAELVPRIHAAIATECEDNAHLAGALEREMLEKFRDDFHQLEPRDQAGAIRNVSTTKAIDIDKAALLRGRPTEIHQELKDPGQSLSSWPPCSPVSSPCPASTPPPKSYQRYPRATSSRAELYVAPGITLRH